MGLFSSKKKASEVSSTDLQMIVFDLLHDFSRLFKYNNKENLRKYLKEHFKKKGIEIIKLSDQKVNELYEILENPRAFGIDKDVKNFVRLISDPSFTINKTEGSSRRDVMKTGGKLLAAGIATTAISTPVEALAKIILNKLEKAYYLQFSANQDKKWADNNFDYLRKQGFYNVFLYEDKGDKDYKILIGPYYQEENYFKDYERFLDLIDFNYSKEGFPKEFMILTSSNGKPEILKVVRLESEEQIIKVDNKGKKIIEDHKEIERFLNDSIIRKRIERIEKEKLKRSKTKRDLITLRDNKKKKPIEIKSDISNEDMGDLDKLINKKVDEYNSNPWYGERIDPFLIKATIKKESDFKPNAIGYDIEKRGNKWVVKLDKNKNKVVKAKGLMQIAKISLENKDMIKAYFGGSVSEARRFFNSSEIFNMEKNIEMGVRHFAYTLDRMTYNRNAAGKITKRLEYRDDLERIKFTLAAYNGGVGAIKGSMSNYRKKNGIGSGYKFEKVKKYINSESREYVPKTLGYRDDFKNNEV